MAPREVFNEVLSLGHGAPREVFNQALALGSWRGSPVPLGPPVALVAGTHHAPPCRVEGERCIFNVPMQGRRFQSPLLWLPSSLQIG